MAARCGGTLWLNDEPDDEQTVQQYGKFGERRTGHATVQIVLVNPDRTAATTSPLNLELLQPTQGQLAKVKRTIARLHGSAASHSVPHAAPTAVHRALQASEANGPLHQGADCSQRALARHFVAPG